jgi:hypothetical protein
MHQLFVFLSLNSQQPDQRSHTGTNRKIPNPKLDDSGFSPCRLCYGEGKKDGSLKFSRSGL